MTIIALLVACAVLLWPSRVDRQRPARPPGRSGRSPGRPRAAGSRIGPRSTPGIAGSRAGRLLTRPGRRARGGPEGGWVAEFAEIVAVGLDAGLDLISAVEVAASTPGVARAAPWIGREVERARARGFGAVEVMVAATRSSAGPPHVQGPDAADLGILIAAWRLTEEVGTAASWVTASAAAAVRERRAARDRLDVATSGPRASMALLTGLPLVGPIGGAVVGFGPARLYGDDVGRAAFAVGLVLTATGWWWSRAMVRRAARPGLTGGSAVP